MKVGELGSPMVEKTVVMMVGQTAGQKVVSLVELMVDLLVIQMVVH